MCDVIDPFFTLAHPPLWALAGCPGHTGFGEAGGRERKREREREAERESASKETMQVFVRTLAGSTVVVDLSSSGADTVSALKERLESKTGIPRAHQRLATFSGRSLRDDSSLLARGCSPGTTVNMVGTLLGGKGGFGSQLRSSKSSVKTTNFDSCRDLSGRRLGGAEAEKKLAKWKAQEEDRRLQKVAEKHLREVAKAERREEQERVNIQEFREELELTSEKVASAVKDGLKQALKASGSKRKKDLDLGLGAGASTSSKRPTTTTTTKKKIFGLDLSDSDSESD